MRIPRKFMDKLMACLLTAAIVFTTVIGQSGIVLAASVGEKVCVTFNVTDDQSTPAGISSPTITVTNNNGGVSVPQEGGSFYLTVGETYTYTVSASGYETVSRGDYSPTDDGNVSVTLRAIKEISFTVLNDAFVPLPGATVTLSQAVGDYPATGTTDTNGQVTLWIYSNDNSYRYSVTGATGYKDQSGNGLDVSNENEDAFMHPAEPELDETNLNLTYGTNGTLTVTNVAEGATYTCSSSNPDVAEVSSFTNGSCTITTKAAGNASITVTVKAGTDYNNKVCTVTVVSADPTVGITTTPLNSYGDEQASTVDAKGAKLTATVPSDATGTVTFYMKDDSGDIELNTVSVDSGTATYSFTDDTYISASSLLQTGVTFYAVYNGDSNYNEAASNDATVQYYQTLDLEVDSSSIFATSTADGKYTWSTDGSMDVLTVDYDTYVAGGINIALDGGTYDVTEDTITYEYSGVATVANTGSISLNGLGETTITVTRAENSQTGYTASTFTFKLVVADILHRWGTTVYTWSDDGKSCTATRTCEIDSTHVEEATAIVTGEETKAATCTEDGETTYTAVFNESWASEQTKVVADISAKGHTAEIQNAKDATCTEDGYTGDEVCTVCGETITAGETIPATGHSYIKEVIAATYTEQGYTLHTCECGDSYMDNYTAILVLDGTDSSVSTQTTAQSLTVLPDGLKGIYSSVDELIADLISRIVATTGYTEDNTLVYDVVLQYSTDGGATWITATVDNFPTDGITVTLPYPEGTDSTYDFAVLHMFTVDSVRLGITAGETESPTVTKTDDGLVVTLTGLSPVAISWQAPTTTNTTTTTSAKTGDSSQIALWIALLAVSGVGIVGMAAYCAKRRRSR